MVDEMIGRMIALEWEMFQKVNEGEPLEACQLMPETFYGMRKGQFMAWSQEVRDSYYRDLVAAKEEGRNLVAEKYIYMMEHIDVTGYAYFSKNIIMPDEQKRIRAKRINHLLLQQTITLFNDYPLLSRSARPLYSTEDSEENTSIETYQLGELMTYSHETLIALEKYIQHLEQEGVSLARLILENSVRYYGFSDLDQAEENLEIIEKEKI